MWDMTGTGQKVRGHLVNGKRMAMHVFELKHEML